MVHWILICGRVQGYILDGETEVDAAKNLCRNRRIGAVVYILIINCSCELCIGAKCVLQLF